jgi:hypothetical protein
MSTEYPVVPAHLVAEEEEFDEDAFDEEFDEEELGDLPAGETFDDDPPLGDPEEELPVSEEIPGAEAAEDEQSDQEPPDLDGDDEDEEEEEGEQTGRFQV